MTDGQRVWVVASDGVELDAVVHRPASGAHGTESGTGAGTGAGSRPGTRSGTGPEGTVLLVHGISADRDDCVSFDIARDVAATVPHWEFRPLPGAGHGFHSPEHEPEAVAVTARWLARGMTAQGGTV
ncbi:alpha/beta fold hydrolase [Streptomyces sp. NPDC087422]|uniref:alpha/beta fold hydrolase n=1 Tax=Streptomyces sp. NPDC087422 TaxID=3365786 RepID=UPI00382D0A26